MGFNLSCPDWADRLRAGRSLVPDLPLDFVEGQRAVNIFNKLRLFDVVGTPTMGEAGGDWFRDIVRALFGSLDQVTRVRMIQELFLLVPKKNSKTTNGALLMLTALLMNRRPNASLIMTAPVQDTAQLAFDAAAGAIKLDPVLMAKLHIREHLKTIIHRETGAALEIMTFDPATLTGTKPVYVLIDELHVVAKMGKAASALRQIRGGMLPFPEGFLAFITTQSEDQPSGIYASELTKARAIRDGKRDGRTLPVMFEFPMDMQKEPTQWRDPANWTMVTPNAGKSIDIPRLIEAAVVAEQTSEAEFRAWASQHLNIQIGVALLAQAWVGAQYWEGCESPELLSGHEGLEQLMARSDVVTIGVDGGGLDDMLGLAIIGRDAVTKKWLVWVHAWIQRSVLELRESEAPKFLDFEEQGDLTIVDLPGADIDELADIVATVEDSGLLDRIGVDRAGIQDVVDAIKAKRKSLNDDNNKDQPRIVGVPQGWSMVGIVKTVERKLKAKEIEHAGTPLMAFCLGNARAEPRGNAVIITKQTAGTAKIDPLMALFDAATLMSMNPKPRKKKFQVFFA